MDENIGRLYLAGLFASGLIVPTYRIKSRTIYKHWLTPWKRVATAKLIRVPILGQDTNRITNWDVYESSRIW